MSRKRLFFNSIFQKSSTLVEHFSEKVFNVVVGDGLAKEGLDGALFDLEAFVALVPCACFRFDFSRSLKELVFCREKLFLLCGNGSFIVDCVGSLVQELAHETFRIFDAENILKLDSQASNFGLKTLNTDIFLPKKYLDSESESETIFLNDLDIVSVSVMFVVSRLKFDKFMKGTTEFFVKPSF